ncbi:hypothetical protein D3C80_1220840 [compost metagenome]
MEIGDQGIDHMERPPGENKDVSVAAEWLEHAITRRAFKRTHARCTNCHHAATTGAARGHGINHILADFQPFLMHVMVFDTLHTHRLERTGAHVQGHERHVDALGLDRRKQRVIEVQPRRRCRHRAGALGVDGLITLAIGTFVRAVDVRR